jgi:hypothetical protein
LVELIELAVVARVLERLRLCVGHSLANCVSSGGGAPVLVDGDALPSESAPEAKVASEAARMKRVMTTPWSRLESYVTRRTPFMPSSAWESTVHLYG